MVFNAWATVLGWGGVQLITGFPAIHKTNVTVITNADCNKTQTVYNLKLLRHGSGYDWCVRP